MVAAVIIPTAGTVTNVIVADADKDYPSLGSVLVNVPDGVAADTGYTWDSINGFQEPSIPPTE